MSTDSHFVIGIRIQFLTSEEIEVNVLVWGWNLEPWLYLIHSLNPAVVMERTLKAYEKWLENYIISCSGGRIESNRKV